MLIFTDSAGSSATWVEEVSHRGYTWGLGCTLCGWSGFNSKFSRGVYGWDNPFPFICSLRKYGQITAN
eukprot:12934792-Prorocentrum_lima.AAC.1